MDLSTYFEEFQKILVVCPHDGEVYRLSDLHLYYYGGQNGTWYDDRIREIYALKTDLQQVEKQRDLRKAENTRNADVRLMSYMPDADPIISRFRYDGRDMKLLIDPVEFIVFEGLNKEDIQNVVLLDTKSANKERLHDGIREVLEKQRYDWITLHVSETAKLIPSWSYFRFDVEPDKLIESSFTVTEDQLKLIAKLKGLECKTDGPTYKACSIYRQRDPDNCFCSELIENVMDQKTTFRLNSIQLGLLVYLLRRLRDEGFKQEKKKAEVDELINRLLPMAGDLKNAA